MEETWYSDQHFACSVDRRIAVFRMKEDALRIGTDLGLKEVFFQALTRAEKSDSVDGILLLDSAVGTSEEDYAGYLRGMVARGRQEAHMLISREEIAFNQLILRIVDFRKVVGVGLRGRVATPFLGVALCSDIRLLAEDTEIEMGYREQGLPACGGIGFFLPRHVGLGNAMKIMLTQDAISADHALGLGLANEVLPVDDFENLCVSRMHGLLMRAPELCASAARSLRHSYSSKDLELCLEREVVELVGILSHSEEQSLS